MKKHIKIIYFSILVVGSFFLADSFFSTNPPIDSNDLIPAPNEGVVYEHNFYSFSYVEEHEQAEWVAYLLRNRKDLGVFERSNDFREDTLVITGSASLEDYRGSGYDRGHLAPARDMSFSKISMSESFYFSNISPQEPSFNRGIWKSLEGKVTRWGQENGQIYVVSGGVLKDDLPSIGENEVSVPKIFFKVVFQFERGDLGMIAFLIPNQKGKKELYEYAITVDQVEKETGIDFFPGLENKLETDLESKIDLSAWGFISS
jgi:endonuclease G, mitochondrial